MKTIQTKAIIEGIRAKVDRSLGLTVSTPELSPQEKAMFMELQGINVELTIKPTDEVAVEEYKVTSDLDEKKPSTRMRSVMFLLWKQNDEGLDFDGFYRKHMEVLIEHLKGKLEPKDYQGV